MRKVEDYLNELEKTKGERSDQVREGLELYVALWRRAMDKGVVAASDSVDDALLKLERMGGLLKAAEDQAPG